MLARAEVESLARTAEVESGVLVTSIVNSYKTLMAYRISKLPLL